MFNLLRKKITRIVAIVLISASVGVANAQDATPSPEVTAEAPVVVVTPDPEPPVVVITPEPRIITVETYENIIEVLAAVVVVVITVSMGLQGFQNRTALQLLQLILPLALNMARSTPTPVDDNALKLVAETLGYVVVTNADGSITLKPKEAA